MAIEMNLLSLNSEGAFRTMMHRRMPHIKNITSTVDITNSLGSTMSRRTRRLEEKEIEKYLFGDIPSDNGSICSCEDDEEEAENQPNPMVLGDLIGVQIAHDDIYDSDDNLSLSSRLQRNPDSTV
ncbi:hypothetical protein EVAR_10591_1 [Eumeta japonica]|uniref:Uncharacterized protein n=1 Tax=Eumeta variegata TaxID=151549 RepID=A0A4C1U253_EUMVA|nr:hypothetical protein EVAR_10591_1 [Eumeta japonica]